MIIKLSIFTQEAKDQIRCEFRSNGACVRNVALKWNGGGTIEHLVLKFMTKKIQLVIKDCEKEVLNIAKYE